MNLIPLLWWDFGLVALVIVSEVITCILQIDKKWIGFLVVIAKGKA